jgi:hypothetical protein
VVLTEAEAKKKLCVDFQRYHPISSSIDRVRCEGSECMAWKWWPHITVAKFGCCGKVYTNVLSDWEKAGKP